MARFSDALRYVNGMEHRRTSHLPRGTRVAVLAPASLLLMFTASACTSGGPSASSAGSTAASTAVASTPSGKPPTKAVGPSMAKTTVAPPSRGSVKSTVSSRPVPSAPKVPLSGVADFGGKVTSRMASVRSINATAHIPGEVAGPAVALTVQMDNGSDRSIDLGTVTVNVYTAAGTPGIPLTENGSSLFSGSLPAGRSAQGTYVFSLPTARRNPITVTIRYSTDAPLVTFVGTAK